MSINEGTYGDFANELQDEDQLDAHPAPGIEIGYDIQRDCGSGSYAEDGRREVREDRPIMDGENPMIGSAAMYGPTEIGEGLYSEDGGSEIGGPYAQDGAFEIGANVAAHGVAAHGAAGSIIQHIDDLVSQIAARMASAGPSVAAHGGAAGPMAAAHGVATHGVAARRSGLPRKSQGKVNVLGLMDVVGALAAHASSTGDAGSLQQLRHIEQMLMQIVSQSGPGVAAHGVATHGVAAHLGFGGFDDELGAGLASQEGQTEIGAGEDTLGTDSLMQPFETFMLEPERIGCEDEMGSAAMYGPTEIGAGLYPVDGGSEIGEGLASQDGQSEIGEGWAAAEGQSEIGAGLFPVDGASEIGALYPTNGLSEMGAGYYPVDGASEIGMDDERAHEEWYDDIQHLPSGREIGAKAAIVKVVEKARDNRQPAPPMKAVDVDAPLDEDEDTFLSDIVLGATVAAPGAAEPFPLLSQLLLRAGVNVEPRIVRVDTEESYKQFRTAQSPALSEVKALSDRLEAHIADPNAHELDSEDIDDDIEDLVHLGEEAQATEAQKRVDLWMPKRFDGKVEAWKQGDTVCVSMALPGRDGDVRICTSIEPMRKCIEEMCRHAGEAQVGHHVADVLPEMGCVLGAGTVMKEIAAAAPAILARPEAQVKLPFVVRIEPKTSPNLAALVMLAAGARQGNAQAANEWAKLASMSAPAVKLAMLEAAAVAKSATEV